MADFNSSNTASPDQDQQQQDANPSQRRGTGFTNLQKYLDANTLQDPNDPNAPQQLDQYVGNQIKGESQGFQNDLGQLQTDVSDQATKLGPDLNKQQTDMSSIFGNLGIASPSDQPGTLTNNSPATAPTYSPTDDQVSEFQSWLNPTTPQWQNPDSANAAQSKAYDLQGLGSQLQQGNVQGILQRYGGNGQYSQGQQNFDTMLLRNPTQIQSSLSSLGGAGNQVNNIISGGQQQLVDNVNKSKDAALTALYGQGGSASNVTGGAIGGVNTDIGNTVSQDKQAAQKAFLDLQNKLGTPSQTSQYGNLYGIDPGTFGQLGLDPKGNYVLGTDINAQSYVNQAADPTAGNAASANQLAQLNALAKLGGTAQTWLDPSQVGTYNPAASFNSSKFTQDTAAKSAAIQAAYQPALTEWMNALNRGDQEAGKMWGDRVGAIQKQMGWGNNLYQDPTPTATVTRPKQTPGFTV